MTNALEFHNRVGYKDDIGRRHFRYLARIVEEFIENIGKQDESLKTQPIAECDFEICLGLNYIDFRHRESKRRDDDYCASIQYGATIMDVASSARKEPWAALTLLLIAFRETWHGDYRHDLTDLVYQVKDLFSASVAKEALRRLSGAEEAEERKRRLLAEDGEETPCQYDPPF